MVPSCASHPRLPPPVTLSCNLSRSMSKYLPWVVCLMVSRHCTAGIAYIAVNNTETFSRIAHKAVNDTETFSGIAYNAVNITIVLCISYEKLEYIACDVFMCIYNPVLIMQYSHHCITAHING